MDKQNLYVALLNAVLGVVISLMLKGSLLIYGLGFVALLTILLVERRRIYEKIFRGKFWWAVTGYATVLFAMVGVLLMVNRSNRDRSLIIKTTHDFIGHLKPEEYAEAYKLLSEISKKSYPLESFIKDNRRLSVKIEDFRIDEVEFNEFDKKKAVVKVSSAFLIYGQNSMAFELVKENSEWRLVFTPAIAQQKVLQEKVLQARQSPGGVIRVAPKRRTSGGIGAVFRSLF